MKSFLPSAALRSRVASIDVLEVGAGDAVVLPSTSAVLGFQYRGRVRTGDALLAPAGITGIQSASRTYSYEPGTGSVLVRFTPDGASCLGVPGAALADRSVALDALLPPARVAEVRERLEAASDVAARVAVVEHFLAELPHVGDPLVRRALALLDAGANGLRVADVAHALGLSLRQLERRFLARVGVTPKRFAALRRFERAMAQARTAPSLTGAALDAGYYDQSHFIRDFRVGLAMSDLSNSGRSAASRLRGMTNPTHPDLFTNVHKGIRRALFSACVDLGRAAGDAERERSARERLAEALHFVAHHGDNEDQLLLPLLRERAPEAFARMTEAHAALDRARATLVPEQPTPDLYLAACAFTARYLAHMDDEERGLSPIVREVLSVEEAIAFGRRAVERTAPQDQRMMLGWMLPAMTGGDVATFLGGLPPALAAELRPLVDSASR